jgi:hypothetical protein
MYTDVYEDFDRSHRLLPRSNTSYVLYPPPNGGKRVLPSVYTLLTDTWVRGDGVEVAPADMNGGHIENTLKLLCESHGNAVDRSCERVGRIANHFSNQPEIVRLLSEACLLMQKVDVRDMYPIADALQAVVEGRKTRDQSSRSLPHPDTSTRNKLERHAKAYGMGTRRLIDEIARKNDIYDDIPFGAGR